MKRQLFALLFALVSTSVVAQSVSMKGMVQFQMRSMGVILQNDQVKGYYYFYKVDKSSRKNVNYHLSIHDENLREISTIEITRPITYDLIDAVFNGEAFAFLFFDYSGRTSELLTYDRALKQTGSTTRPVKNKHQRAVYNAIANGAQATQAYLIPLAKKGFLQYTLREEGRYEYEILCYDNTANLRWSDRAADKTVEFASEAFQSTNYVGTLISKKKNVNSQDSESILIVHHVETGEKLFRTSLTTDDHTVSPSNMVFDEQSQTFHIFGEYHDIKDKTLRSDPLGFITLTLNTEGNIVHQKTNSWANEISAAAPVNERGKFDGNNSRILFHDFVRTDDGRVFAVGEQYKKAANAAGIAANVLLAAATGSTNAFSNAQINIYNMVIFEFTDDFTLRKVHIFEKDKNVLALPAGFELLSPRLLSYYAKAVGGFDYSFTQRSSDMSSFHVTYVNYDRESGQPGKNVLGTIVYTPEKVFIVDSVPLGRRSARFLVNRAKEGYVMVTEYFKKEKRVDSRLEKINY